MPRFQDTTPSLDNYWRAVILFGRNVASYKFALAQSLLSLAQNRKGGDLVTLDELAKPFAANICAHLKAADKQGTSGSSRFLKVCRDFNSNSTSEIALLSTTAQLGFVNVIDAFHIVSGADIPQRFFIDERTQNKGIRLTDNLFKLQELFQGQNLPIETEARWRLIETAWELGLSRRLLAVSHDIDSSALFVDTGLRRTNITSCRDALNGYQKGRCFYCFREVSVASKSASDVEVDHFFPHALKGKGVAEPVDGVWNLVLCCSACNRGKLGKHARVPHITLLDRLHRRNEYLIASQHPLRETIICQTGQIESIRRGTLQKAHAGAKSHLIHDWLPVPQADPAF